MEWYKGLYWVGLQNNNRGGWSCKGCGHTGETKSPVAAQSKRLSSTTRLRSSRELKGWSLASVTMATVTGSLPLLEKGLAVFFLQFPFVPAHSQLDNAAHIHGRALPTSYPTNTLRGAFLQNLESF